MSQKKQLQRLKLAEDERKLQTKRFVKQSVWKSQDGNHRLMMSGKSKDVSTEKSGLFCFRNRYSDASRHSEKRRFSIYTVIKASSVMVGVED